LRIRHWSIQVFDWSETAISEEQYRCERFLLAVNVLSELIPSRAFGLL
jgi:hypothetical protein